MPEIMAAHTTTYKENKYHPPFDTPRTLAVENGSLISHNSQEDLSMP